MDLAYLLKAREILDAQPVPEEDRYIMFDDWQYAFSDYQIEAVSTLGPDRDIKSLALGVGGEAGEVMEIILAAYMTRRAVAIGETVKKGTRPGKTVDVVHLKEEIGDVLWYLAVLADTFDLDLDEIAMENIDKLKERYASDAR